MRLIFKSARNNVFLGGLLSTDGIHFHSSFTMLKLDDWQENEFTHNVALAAPNVRGRVRDDGRVAGLYF
jgi:hypothetical protein